MPKCPKYCYEGYFPKIIVVIPYIETLHSTLGRGVPYGYFGGFLIMLIV